ncbi:AAA family ATPase [Bathymodiolus septemdierum thioautotrophic gill symbiont]|uniref:Uncharacterized protein n=1 Tax=endosymbiont of Bathymodiolus septemdierum str. Myojin knoll TaxID=1303921 RepID=A0A0P0UQT4_9GAMM|nr:AAA family ATPase [Bathymodiolus septemdierum thioautotrophic gill symbiont]BAS67137.1 hypothetical protein BSEPE_0113 [endosymbiont of Bathymodiolus septemdierum str. Myojin knoll]
MNTKEIHEKAFGVYLRYYESTKQTFYLRKNKTKELINGYWFQGKKENNYVATSPFKPADNDNKTQRICFVIKNDKSCCLEFSYRAFTTEEEKYQDFYKSVLEYFDISFGSLKNRHIKKINYSSTHQNWETELQKFLHTDVKKIIEIAKEHNVPDEYLFFSDQEFETRRSAINKIQIVLKQMDLYDARSGGFKINANVHWHFKILGREGEKSYPTKAITKNIASEIDLANEYSTRQAESNLKSIFGKYVGFIDINDKGYTMTASKQPLNQILYGPPGTGKTYSTVEKALKILAPDDYELQKESITSIGKLKEKFTHQVEFVTFHQSFSYEDFVEGLKAKTENGKISYEIENGVFKEICNNASSKAEITNVGIDLKTDITIWKMSLGSKGDTAKQYFSEAEESDSLVLGWGELVDFTDCKNREEINDKLGNNIKASQVNYFKNEMKIGDIVIISDGNYKFKAIAEITGEYYFDEASELPQKRKIKWLQKFSNSRPVLEISSKNFTQTTINKPKHIDRGKLQAYLTDTQSIDNNKPYILIIDEINRGNISRIFGELITLIEPSKRTEEEEEISVKLPYSKDDFSVPKNLYIIGTMNTADRSLALMDTALRRRFDFIEMMPDVGLITNDCGGVNLQEMLETINQRIEVLYDREHTIGHSFLMGIDNLEQLRNAFKNKILPLLEEYFYDDFEKINLVLGNDSFYKKETKQVGEISKDIYQKQDISELNAEYFIQIYSQKADTE